MTKVTANKVLHSCFGKWAGNRLKKTTAGWSWLARK